MAQLGRFFTTRAVREYTEQHSLPAAAAYRDRAVDKARRGIWLSGGTSGQKWTALRFGELRLKPRRQHVLEVELYLEGRP